MDAFFRAVAIGLGVLMGTFHQGVEPELDAEVHKADGVVLVSATLRQAVSPKMEEALEAGVPMALTLQAAVSDRPGPSLTRVLTYQPLSRQWQVAEANGPVLSFATRAEATVAWTSWSNAVAGTPPSGPFGVLVSVSLSFPDRPDWQADMVWRVPVVVWRKSFTRLSEIPF